MVGQSNDLEMARALLQAGADANRGNDRITAFVAGGNEPQSARSSLCCWKTWGRRRRRHWPHGETPLMALHAPATRDSIRLFAPCRRRSERARDDARRDRAESAAAEDHAERFGCS